MGRLTLLQSLPISSFQRGKAVSLGIQKINNYIVMKTNLLSILVLSMGLSSCITGGLVEEDLPIEQSKEFLLREINPEVIGNGMKVYFSIQTQGKTTNDPFLVTIDLLDRHKQPMGIQSSVNLNPKQENLPKGEILRGWIPTALPDSIINKGGTVYVDATVAGVALERIMYTHLLFTEISPEDWDDSDGEIVFTPWDPTDPNDPNNPNNK